MSVDTLLEWTLRYRRNGLTALAPKPRLDRGQTRAVTPETAALIERLKRENRPKGVPNSPVAWSRRYTAEAPSQTAKLARKQRENLGGKDRDPLHN